MQNKFLRRAKSERGAILIMIGISMMALTAMSAFVLDYGVFWMARRQAQNVADAAALAGAIGLMYDSSTNLSSSGPAYLSASATANANKVFGVTPSVRIFVDPSATWTPSAPSTCVTLRGCVQASVYRDGTNSSTTLPVYFAPLFGVNSQGVRATATAQVKAANGSGCMRPWFITERYTDANHNSVYDSPPDTLDPWQLPGDVGNSVIFHPDNGTSSYGQLDVGAGGADINAAIEHCVSGREFYVGDVVLTKPGVTLGPETQGIDDLFAWDPDYNAVTRPSGVKWDSTNKVLSGGCAATSSCRCPDTASRCPYGGGQSPRIVQAAVCSPADPDCNGSATGAGEITITNILSFFITAYDTGGGVLNIHAVVIGSAGLYRESSPTPTNSFLKFISLVR